jgi:hypothetical protein
MKPFRELRPRSALAAPVSAEHVGLPKLSSCIDVMVLTARLVEIEELAVRRAG